MPEEEQEIGRVGAKRVQRLLEATLRFRLPYDAYQHKERVSLRMLTGHYETYDLNGDHLDEDAQEVTRVYVESKNLAGAGNQSWEFTRFLAQAYSATKSVIDDSSMDPKYEFMWATTCPWKGDGFRQVASWEAVKQAVEQEAARDETVLVAGKKWPKVVPDGCVPDDDLVRTVAERIWVWVISDKQEKLSLSGKMRGWIRERLEQDPS